MIRTRVCEVLGITHPIAQAGMARYYTGADLVAAVSAAGGLGTLGCHGRPADEAIAEIGRIRALTDRPFAVNFVLHLLDDEAFSACLSERVPVFVFFRGDPAEAIARAHAVGAKAICQVTTVEEAVRARDAGVDVLIAQGREAGGHMGPIALNSILPAVVDVAGGIPVLAAGSLVDGRGLAAMLCLGADGVVMGTRFLATPEAPHSAVEKQALLDAGPGATVESEMFDIIWGDDWPGVHGRALRNRFTDRWVGREEALRTAREEALAELQRAEQASDTDGMIVLAGEGVGLIDELRPAGEIVRETAAQAERILQQLAESSSPLSTAR